MNLNFIRKFFYLFLRFFKTYVRLIIKFRGKNFFILQFLYFKIFKEGDIVKKLKSIPIFNQKFLYLKNLYFLKNLFKNIFFNLICNIKYIILENSTLNAYIIFKFIYIQLKANRPISLIMRTVYKELSNNDSFKGFKILLRGRFTRKERAFNQVWHAGSVPLSTIVKPINYYSHFFVSKFGVGSIRVWVYF